MGNGKASFGARRALGIALLTCGTVCSGTLKANNFAPRGEWHPPVPGAENHGSKIIGNRAYYAAGSAGLLIFDISNESSPVQIGSYADGGEAVALDVRGDYAFVADGWRELQIVNVADPANPYREAGFYAVPPPGVGGYYASVPTVSGTDLVLDGNLLYLADSEAGLQIVDVTDPANPVLSGYYYTVGSAFHVSLRDKLATVYSFSTAYGPGGVSLIDVSNPKSPFLAADPGPEINLPSVGAVALAGNLAYVGSDGRGMDILDLSVPARPVRLGGVSAQSYVSKIAVDGGLALMANYSNGAQIVDVSDPSSPMIVGNFSPAKPGEPLAKRNVFGVALKGKRGYVAAGDLYILDLTVPANPQLLGVYRSGANTYRVTVLGDLAFLAKWNDGPLEVVNVSDPANPVAVGVFPTTAFEVALEGTRAYLATDSGLKIFDVSNPAQPGLLGAYLNHGQFNLGRGIALSGHFAFLGDNFDGVLGFDVADPSHPELRGQYDSPGWAGAVATAGNLVVVADNPGGLRILEERISNPIGLRISMVGGVPTMDVKGIVGRECVLEYSDNPGLEHWKEGFSFVVQSNPQRIQDQILADKHRFYRVREK